MKTKIKHALVFASVAVLITLPLLALATARAHGGNRIDIGEEMRLFSPQAVHHQMIKLKYEKYQGPKENPQGDRQVVEGERVRDVGRVEGEKITAIVTAYSKRETCPDSPCITASGENAARHIAACPRRLDLGTRIEIGGTRFVCRDRLHPRFDSRFDIWFGETEADYEEALAFGRQWKEITIVE